MKLPLMVIQDIMTTNGIYFRSFHSIRKMPQPFAIYINQYDLRNLIIFLFLLLPNVYGNELNQHIDVRYYNPAAKNRTFILAENSPLAKVISQDYTIHSYLEDAVKLFRTVTNVMDERIKRRDPLACNLDFNYKWLNTSRQTMASRQIGIVDNFCHCSIDARQAEAVGDLSHTTRKYAREIIVNARHALFNAIASLPQVKTLTDHPHLHWNNGFYELKGWNLDRDGQACQLDRLSMLHKDGVLYFYPEITNNPVDAVVPDPQRQGVLEFVREDYKDSLKMRHPRYIISEGKVVRGSVVEGTTILSRWSNRATLASVGIMNFDSNPALRQAYMANARQIDIASDSITISNTAILALPLIMSLFPVAFLTDLTTFSMLMYIIFTDIFSVIPFLIKGIELVSTSRGREEMVAFRAGNMNMGQTEIWVGSCRGGKNFRTAGIVFIVISIVVMVLGLLLELAAKRYKSKKRDEFLRKLYGPFGFHLLDRQRRLEMEIVDKAYEKEYEQEKERRYSSEKLEFDQEQEAILTGNLRHTQDSERYGHLAM